MNHTKQNHQRNQRFWTGISLVALLLTVVAVSSSPISAAALAPATQTAQAAQATQAAQPVDHKVIFIQGVNSESGNGSCDAVGFIEDGQNRCSGWLTTWWALLG